METVLSSGNRFNLSVSVDCFIISRFILQHGRLGSGSPVRPVPGPTASGDGLALSRSAWAHVRLRCLPFCLDICFFPFMCIVVSFLFAVSQTLFSSGTLHHYFPILHVACWVSSRCQLPAEWCIPPLSEKPHSNCLVIVCPVLQHVKAWSFITSVDFCRNKAQSQK